MKRTDRILKISTPLIAQFEGFISEPYYDIADLPTRGYGELLSREPLDRKYRSKFYRRYGVWLIEESYCREQGWTPVSREQGLQFLRNHSKKDLDYVMRTIRSSDLNDNQIAAILSLVYNIGRTAWKNSTVRKRINKGRKIKMVARAWGMWRRAGGRVSQGLVRRRQIELELYQR